jgi:hypothetical protein
MHVADRLMPWTARLVTGSASFASLSLRCCSKALGGGIADVLTLDGRKLRVPLKEVVRPGYERVVAGEGGCTPTASMPACAL